jgi:hypothetical protein
MWTITVKNSLETTPQQTNMKLRNVKPVVQVLNDKFKAICVSNDNAMINGNQTKFWSHLFDPSKRASI